jgi:hypothetical protein
MGKYTAGRAGLWTWDISGCGVVVLGSITEGQIDVRVSMMCMYLRLSKEG